MLNPLKSQRSLKDLLHSSSLEFLMEAHDGLSAKIVEETGFAGIWASGLSMSAAMGLRDCNEASWTQVVDQAAFMRDATSIPILLDGDSGFGDFNIFRRVVKKLGQVGIDGVCIEDKLYPKRNSFATCEQKLCDADEFCGKIKAAKDSQLSEDFAVVARLEGYIVGLSTEEVLERAYQYNEAGADAILVHSKIKDASQVLEFAKLWDADTPLVIVPTTYNQTPTSIFEEAGFSAAIWANHNLRTVITAMQETCQHIFEKQSTAELEAEIAPIAEVFRLQNMEELTAAEAKYLAGGESGSSALGAKSKTCATNS